MPQVVIVGAGPTGATLALLLVQQGIGVTLVEASLQFRRQFRGQALMPSGLDALAQMGLLPLLDAIPHRALDAWEFWIEGRSLFRVAEPLDPTERPCMLVPQAPLLEAILAQAHQYPTFRFLAGTPVKHLLWDRNRVCGVVLADQTIVADLVIGADGRSSTVRQQAGFSMAYQPQPFDILWFTLADGPNLPQDCCFFSVLKGQDAFGMFRGVAHKIQVGWTLHPKDVADWQRMNWLPRLAAASPPWLAAHFRAVAASFARPVRLSVQVGRCPQWAGPGVLLLGDAAHPMSPIRAQGINMALRDVIVAANHLVPLLKLNATPATLDAALGFIQAEREPDIVRAQRLQQAEANQAELLHQFAIARWGVSRFAPLLRVPIRESWLRRQRQLRQGATSVCLRV